MVNLATEAFFGSWFLGMKSGSPRPPTRRDHSLGGLRTHNMVVPMTMV